MAVAFSTCPLCEATCGLQITVDDGAVTGDPRRRRRRLSATASCAPRALRSESSTTTPTGCARRSSASPTAAFAPPRGTRRSPRSTAACRPISGRARPRRGGGLHRQPAAHNLELAALRPRRCSRRCGTQQHVLSASTVDQYPKQMASALMFGSGATVAVPDVDRTDHLLILGANPLASNGSLLTAPDMRGRLRAIRARGGTDRRRRPAAHAHRARGRRAPLHPPRHRRAAALRARARAVRRGPRRSASARARTSPASTRSRALAGEFSPEAVAADVRDRGAGRSGAWPASSRPRRAPRSTGASAPRTQALRDDRELARRRPQRRSPATSTAPAARCSRARRSARRTRRGEPGRGRGARLRALAQPRARAAARSSASCPRPCLAEEIETPGEGQVRALITIAGNPAAEHAQRERLPRALERLDFMVSVDIYVNETTRHADVILPAPSPLQRSHYDVALYGFAVRNVANYSPPVLDARPRPARRVGDAAAPDRRGHRPGPGRRRRRDRPTSWRSRRLAGRSPTRTRASTVATPRSCSPSWRRASGPSGSSTSCCAPGPTA